MHYINPYELLNINSENLSDINSALIKKTKKQLLIEIGLNNDRYNYKGIELTKAVCNTVIDELEDENKKAFHWFIYKNKNLNDFLSTGALEFFERYKFDSIYNSADFINFISPYFSERFDRTLLKAFQDQNLQLFNSILKYQYLISQSDLSKSFKSLDNEIKNRISEIDSIRQEIKENKSHYTERIIEEIVAIVKQKFPVSFINSLPAYFQSQINKIAASINYLQLAIWESFTTITQVSYDLLEYLLKMNIDSASKPTFENNYKIVKQKNDENIEREKNAPILRNWATVLNQIREITKRIDDKTVQTKSVGTKINGILNISELNTLPSFGNEIRNQIAYALRSLSISSWNSQSDIETALSVINLSLSINVSPDVKEKLKDDLQELIKIKQEREIRGEPFTSVPTLHTINGIGTTIYGNTLYFVFFGIPIIPISRWNCMPTGTGYRFFGKYKLHTWQKVWQWSLIGGVLLWIIIGLVQSNSSSSSYSYNDNSYTPTSPQYVAPSTTNSLTDTTTTFSQPIEPVYNIVQMKNGNVSNCSGFKPTYDYSIDNKLIITAELTDAAVKIFNYETDKCIRFVFINNGTTYTVKNIPEGKYYLKIAYGSDWSVKDGDPICKGHFASHALYKKDDELYDFNKVYYADGKVSIPYYTLKLYTTYSYDNIDKNSSQNQISENDFFNDNQ